MYNFFKICLLFILLDPGKVSFAQENWNLDRCIKYALENNLALQDQMFNIEIQQTNLAKARNQRFPGISAETDMYEGFGRSLDKSNNTYVDVNFLNNSYSLGTSVMLFNGFTYQNRIAFEKYNLQAEKNVLEYQKNQLIYNVMDAYYKVLLRQGNYKIAGENLNLSREQYVNIQKLIEVSRKAESDIYELQSKMATDSFTLIQQKGEMEKALLNLKMMMHFPFADTLLLDTINYIPIIPQDHEISVDSLLHAGSKSMASLKITENRLIAAKKSLAEARGNFSPSLSAYAGWGTYYSRTKGQDNSSFREQFKNRAGENIGLNLSIPLFYKFSKINNVKMAKLNYKRAEIAHQTELLKIENEINSAYINWQTGLNEHAAALQQHEKSKIAYETAEKKLFVGQLNIIEYDIQKNELMRSKTEVLRTSLQLLLLERYINFILTGNWQLSE